MRPSSCEFNTKHTPRLVSSDSEVPIKTISVDRLLGSEKELYRCGQLTTRPLASSDIEGHIRLPENRLLSTDGDLEIRNLHQVNRLLASSDSHIQVKNHRYMMSPMKMGTKADGFQRKGQAWFVATELQSDLVVEVGDMSFNLHKFPLLSRSGRLNRLVFESRDTQKDHIKLVDMPGGPDAFELAAKFCYGVAVDLTATNIAAIRCAAEYLEMTEDLEDGNLISKTEAFLSFVVLASWKDSITVLQSCESLSPWAENLQIVRRCSESIAWKACTDPRGISWSFTARGGSQYETSKPTGVAPQQQDSESSLIWNGLKNDVRGNGAPQDWWYEDVSMLWVQYFVKVVSAIRAKGMRPDLVGPAVIQYALRWLPGLDQRDGEGKAEAAEGLFTVKDAEFGSMQARKRVIVEEIVPVLPTHKDSVSCSLLLRLLRTACMLNASATCREELERRVGMQLEQSTLPDLLIPSFNHTNETLFDVDLVHRIVQSFLAQDQAAQEAPAVVNERTYVNGGGSEGGRAAGSSQNAKVKVAKLIDSYLAEVARDANLSVARFQGLAEELPEYARACDDGLYRAVDTYLKAHPGTSEIERKRLCRLMDCQKLSLDACMHAAQNERLPLRVVVQVLFCEQVKLRNAITGSALSAQAHHAPFPRQPPLPSASPYDSHAPDGCAVHPLDCSSDNGDAAGKVGGYGNSSWSTARKEIGVVKQEVEKVKSKYAELQADYVALQRQMDRMAKGRALPEKGGHPPLAAPVRRMSGTGFGNWSSGLKKLGNIFQHAHHISSRLSDDDDSCTAPAVTADGGAAPAAPPTPSPNVNGRRPGRRWRYSIS